MLGITDDDIIGGKTLLLIIDDAVVLGKDTLGRFEDGDERESLLFKSDDIENDDADSVEAPLGRDSIMIVSFFKVKKEKKKNKWKYFKKNKEDEK